MSRCTSVLFGALPLFWSWHCRKTAIRLHINKLPIETPHNPSYQWHLGAIHFDLRNIKNRLILEGHLSRHHGSQEDTAQRERPRLLYKHWREGKVWRLTPEHTGYLH